MEIRADICEFCDSGSSTFIAPSVGKLAIQACLIDGSTSVPYLVHESNIGNQTWPEFWGAQIRIDLGRCVKQSEIETLVSEIMPMLEIAKKGYLYGGEDEEAVFSRDAEDAIEIIHETIEAFEPEFNETCPPWDFLSSYEPAELGILANCTNDELAEIAVALADGPPNYIHAWDLYHALISCRDWLNHE